MELWSHQKEAVNKGKDYFCLFFDTGTGKTRTALEIFNAKREERNLRRIVVIAPLNVCRNWKNEIKTFCSVKHETFIVSGGTPKKKKKEIEAFSLTKGVAFLIINIESFRSSEYMKLLSSIDIDFFIVDEAHNFKTHDSKQTEGLEATVKKINPPLFYMLTGTPTPQGEIDLWSYFTFMKLNKLPFPLWRKKYFVDVNDSDNGKEYLDKLFKFLKSIGEAESNLWYWKKNLLKTLSNSPSPLKKIWEILTQRRLCVTPWIEWRSDMIDKLKAYPKYEVTPEGKEEFTRLLNLCALTAKKDEVLDLPPLLRTQLYFQLPAAHREIYDSMAKGIWKTLESDSSGSADNFLTRMIRLQQITSGIFVHPTTKELSIDDEAKIKCLTEAIEMTEGEQFLIWTIFQASYDRISKVLDKLDISHGFLTGEISPEARQIIMERFQAGEIRALICNPRAGGVGVNLTAASYSIHYSKNFNLIDDLQCEARNYRGGSERHSKIVRIDLLAEDTIDEQIDYCLKNKKTVQDLILDFKESISV